LCEVELRELALRFHQTRPGDIWLERPNDTKARQHYGFYRYTGPFLHFPPQAAGNSTHRDKVAKSKAPNIELGNENCCESKGDNFQPEDLIEVWIGSYKEWHNATFEEKIDPRGWLVQSDGEAEPT